MLRPAEAYALRAELDGLGGVLRRVGVRADAQAANVVGPGEELGKLREQLRFNRRDQAEQHAAAGAIDGDQLAFGDVKLADAHGAAALVDVDRLAAADTGDAEAARDQGRVAGHAAALRQHAARGLHPVDIVRRRLLSHEDHVLSFVAELGRCVRIEDGRASGRAGRGGQSLRHLQEARLLQERCALLFVHIAPVRDAQRAERARAGEAEKRRRRQRTDLAQPLDAPLGDGEDHLRPASRRLRRLGSDLRQRHSLDARVELGVEQLIEPVRRDAQHSLFFANQPFVHHVDGDGDGGARRSLADAALEHVELPLLHGELDVHGVAIVQVKLLRDGGELVVEGAVLLFQRGDRHWRADAGDDVLALGVRHVLAPDGALAGYRIAREGDAGAGIAAHVTEDHRLDVDGGAEVVRDVLDLAVVDSALVVPGIEHRADRQLQLLHRVVREIGAPFLPHERAELRDDLQQRIRGQISVVIDARLLFRFLEDRIELAPVDGEDDVAVHHDEATERVVAEAGVACRRDQPLQRRVVQAQVQDRVHHAGHGELRAGADGDEQRPFWIAQALARLLLHLPQRRLHLIQQPFRHRRAALDVVVAGLGGDGEAGGNGKAQVSHLRQVGAFAAQQILLVLIAFWEEIHVLAVCHQRLLFTEPAGASSEAIQSDSMGRGHYITA